MSSILEHIERLEKQGICRRILPYDSTVERLIDNIPDDFEFIQHEQQLLELYEGFRQYSKVFIKYPKPNITPEMDEATQMAAWFRHNERMKGQETGTSNELNKSWLMHSVYFATHKRFTKTELLIEILMPSVIDHIKVLYNA